jgi:hypothetical protein
VRRIVGQRVFAVNFLGLLAVDNSPGQVRRSGRLAAVRWERLFDDLESQVDAAASEEFGAEVSDRTRREGALLRLADRLACTEGCAIELSVAGAGKLTGVVRRAGPDWALLDPAVGSEILIATAAVLAVRGLAGAATPAAVAAGEVESRLDLGYALRGIARDRSPVSVVLRDGSCLQGTIDRVGADFLDLAEHPLDEPRRPGRIRARLAIGFDGLAAVRA